MIHIKQNYKDSLTAEFSAPVKIRHWVSEATQGATYKHTHKKVNLEIVDGVLFFYIHLYFPEFLETM